MDSICSVSGLLQDICGAEGRVHFGSLNVTTSGVLYIRVLDSECQQFCRVLEEICKAK